MGAEMQSVSSEVFGGVATGIPYTSMGTAGGAVLGFAAVVSFVSFNLAFKRWQRGNSAEAVESGPEQAVADSAVPALDQPLLRAEA